jgi:hypothetical protein
VQLLKNANDWLHTLKRLERCSSNRPTQLSRYSEYIVEAFSGLDSSKLSPLNHAVIKDATATGALSQICLWVQQEKSRPQKDRKLTDSEIAGILNTPVAGCYTPLTLAVEMTHPACVKLLVETGAEIDAPDDTGKAPLMWAAKKANASMVACLLGLGASATVNENGVSAISCASLSSTKQNKASIDAIIGQILRNAPEKLRRLIVRNAPEAEIAKAWADELVTYLAALGEGEFDEAVVLGLDFLRAYVTGVMSKLGAKHVQNLLSGAIQASQARTGRSLSRSCCAVASRPTS